MRSIVPWLKEGWDKTGSREKKTVGEGEKAATISQSQSEELLEHFWSANKTHPLSVLGMHCMYPFKVLAALASGIVYGAETFCNSAFNPRDVDKRQALTDAFKNNSYWSWPSAAISGAIVGFCAFIARGVYDFVRGALRSIVPWLKEGWDKTGSREKKTVGEGEKAATISQSQSEALLEHFWSKNKTHPLSVLGMHCMYPFKVLAALASGIVYGAETFCNSAFNPLDDKKRQAIFNEFKKNSEWSWLSAAISGAIVGFCAVIARVVYDFVRGALRSIVPWLKEGWDKTGSRTEKSVVEGDETHKISQSQSEKLLEHFWSANKTHPLSVLGMHCMYPFKVLAALASGIVYGAETFCNSAFNPLDE